MLFCWSCRIKLNKLQKTGSLIYKTWKVNYSILFFKETNTISSSTQVQSRQVKTSWQRKCYNAWSLYFYTYILHEEPHTGFLYFKSVICLVIYTHKNSPRLSTCLHKSLALMQFYYVVMRVCKPRSINYYRFFPLLPMSYNWQFFCMQNSKLRPHIFYMRCSMNFIKNSLIFYFKSYFIGLATITFFFVSQGILFQEVGTFTPCTISWTMPFQYTSRHYSQKNIFWRIAHGKTLPYTVWLIIFYHLAISLILIYTLI